MKLDLRDVIHVPGGRKDFQFSMDLSQLEQHGRRPAPHPVEVKGSVTNHAGALVLDGEVSTELSLVCDRCAAPFTAEKRVPLHFLLAEKLEDQEADDILLLDGTEIDLEDLARTEFILAMDTKNLCSDDCKGLCAGCGANLNVEPCRCRPEVDPRLAALAQLLDDETE